MAGKLAALTLGVLVACMSGDVGAQAKSDAMARLKLEPSCPEVQKAALRYFNIGKPQVKAFQRGAARKALAPVVEFSGGYASSTIGETSRNFEFGLHNIWLDKGADGWGWDARGKLVWNLPQLVFNAEELDVASLAGLIQGILKEVTRLYYMRRRLQMDLILNPPTDEATRLTKELRLEELTALLDAMTGGDFEKEVKARSDWDGDSVTDGMDNCPNVMNAQQSDADGDEIGDACDDDVDGDEIPNEVDNCPQVPNPGQDDTDGDGTGDACQVVPDGVDGASGSPEIESPF